MKLFRENVFSTLIGFLQSQKIGKIRNYDEERVFFERKKRFHPFKRHLQQNWWVENMPVVAGRLAHLILESQVTSKLHYSSASSIGIRLTSS